jgi:hypothetical protein
LQLERHITDFVQKQSAAIRQLETPCSLHVRTGESAALVTEKLALEQRTRNRRAVQGHKRLLLTLAAFVDRTSNEFLARAGLAQQQHSGIAGSDQFY